MFDFSLGSILAWTGLTGLAGLAIMAFVGMPILPTVGKLAESLLTPVAGVVGQGIASLFKMTIDGGIDVMQTGQRILFVVLCCALSWHFAVTHTWNKVHDGWTLYPKQAMTTAKHRR